MEYRIFRAASVIVTGGILGSVIATAACDQPKQPCVTARGDFAATFTLTSGTGECAGLKADILGVQSYNELTSDGKNRPDPSNSSVAIQAQALGNTIANAASVANGYGDPDTSHHPYALGKFTSAEPSGDFCSVPQLAPAVQNIPALPEVPEVPAVPPDPAKPGDKGTPAVPAVPAVPATSISYDWSNVRLLETASAQGTQFAADLKYTVDGCTATYKVNALYPVAPCDAGDGTPNDVLCGSVANLDAGLAAGSGINPDFAVKCDPTLLVCVLAKDVPSFN